MCITGVVVKVGFQKYWESGDAKNVYVYMSEVLPVDFYVPKSLKRNVRGGSRTSRTQYLNIVLLLLNGSYSDQEYLFFFFPLNL